MMTKDKKFEIINYSFFGLVVLATLILTIVLHLDWLTFACCAVSIFYVVFLSERNLISFFVGFASSATYSFVAYQSHLYGEAIFYLAVDIPLIFVSFFMWRKHMETKYKVETKKLSLKNIFIIALISAVSVVGYGFFLRWLGGEDSFVDALSTVVTLIATILLALRYREQWFMWIIVYAVSIVLWSITFNLLMLIMSASCFLSSFIGFVNWTRGLKKEDENKLETKKIDNA